MILETLKGGELYYHIKIGGKFSVETSRALYIELTLAIEHM